jgi:PAS domain S-box-containing protein
MFCYNMRMEVPPETAAVLLEAIQQTEEAFFLTDTEGVILYVNPAFEKLTGYSSAEVLGGKPSILKSGEHSPEFYKELWGTIKAGRHWSGRLVNRHKSGAIYTEEVRISPITGPDGKIKSFLAVRHDIAREVQLEDQLSHSQKMESMGLLAGQIAHDFNNLLTIVIGSMELISEELKPGSVGLKLAGETLRSSRESANLIKQLLIFARRQESHPVLTTLNEPVRELKILFDSLLGHNVSVAYSLEEALAQVKLEPEHLKQAIMNLAVNARDAMNGSGGIMIRTFNAGPEGLPTSLPKGRYAVFELSDTGPGIPRDVLPHIFEPFFTTKPKGKGTGLGLSTVYGIVHQNNGRIFAGNRAEGGAVFTVYFPASPQPQ